MKKKGFMIPLFLVLVVALTAIVGSVTIVTTTSMGNMGRKIQERKALCIAEAGLNKAIWYLITPPGEGGMGMDWRTAGMAEEFGGGGYTIIVEDGPGGEGVVISSVSGFGGKDLGLQIHGSEDFADNLAGYSLYSGADFIMGSPCEISGNVFADGNVTVPTGSRIVDGVVAVTGGHVVSGGGEYILGDCACVPEAPSLDTTYYLNRIAVAEAGGPNVVQGNKFYMDLNLNGLPLYVNGTVTLAGDITGAGEIVATGDIIVNPNATIGEKIKLIAKSDLNVKTTGVNCPVIEKDVVLFAKNNVATQTDFANQDAIFILGSKNISIGNRNRISGMIYGGTIYVGNNTTIQGILICKSSGAPNTLDDSSSIIYKKHEQCIPPGFKKKIVFGKWSMK